MSAPHWKLASSWSIMSREDPGESDDRGEEGECQLSADAQFRESVGSADTEEEGRMDATHFVRKTSASAESQSIELRASAAAAASRTGFSSLRSTTGDACSNAADRLGISAVSSD